MSSPGPTPIAAKLVEKEAQLKALETRTTLQIQKLSDNNAALARMNHRLNSQLERLKAELDQLEHLTAGNAIVARAKESELASEINGLKHLLKDSLAERATLHAQLVAKQEIVRYLEWRLAQMEQLAEGKGRASGGGGPLSAAFKEAAQVAAGEPPLDSFPVLPDAQSVSTQSSSVSGTNLPRTLLALGQRGLVGIPTTAWAPASLEDAEKENINARHPPRPALDTTPPGTAATNPGQFTPIRSSVRSALGDITLPRHPRALVAEAEDREEQQEEKLDDREAPAVADAISFILVENNVEGDDRRPPSELEGSSTAGASSTDLKKQLFAEYSSADLKYVNDDDEDNEDNGISVKAAIAALEKETKKKDDGLDVQIKQMHTPIAEPSQNSRQQQEQQQHKEDNEKNQTAAASTPDLFRNNNNITNRNKNNGSSAALTPMAGSTPLYSASATPATGLRTSSRVRRSVSYALPPVNRKLRQGDPFTFGDPTTIRKKNPSSSAAAGTGGGGGGGGATTAAPMPRSRTKPRAKYASSSKKHRRKSLSTRINGGTILSSSMETPPHVGVLPAMAEQEDFSEIENGSDGGDGAVRGIFS
ncbi:hypothetical protein Ndes2526B_g02784 [Nannochloris sp. 'desiccata']